MLARGLGSWMTFDAGWLLWLLLALSVACLTVIFDRLIFFITTASDRTLVFSELRRELVPEKLASLRRRLEQRGSLEAHVLSAGISSSCPVEAAERMAVEAQVQRLRSEQNLAFLRVLSASAPLLGLLGTVLALVEALEPVSTGTELALDPSISVALLLALREALVTTAAGLCVALSAVTAHHVFRRIAELRLQRADILARELLAVLHVTAHEHDKFAAKDAAASLRSTEEHDFPRRAVIAERSLLEARTP